MGCFASVPTADTNAKYSAQFIRVNKRYLPHFAYEVASSEEDRVVAFTHWEQVFKETPHSESLGLNSPVGKLYEAFYTILFKESPHLQPLFNSNRAVQGRVLVHISAGMKSLLQSQDLVQKVLSLSILHMKIGVKPEDFDPLGEALIHAMKIISEAEWNDRIELAWRRIYCHAAILILVNLPTANVDFAE